MKTKYLIEFLNLLETSTEDIPEESIEILVSKMPDYESEWLINQLDTKRQQVLDLIVSINKYRQNNE